jgi:hypothetical protein
LCGRFARSGSLIENIATGETFEVQNPVMDPLEVCALLVQVRIIIIWATLRLRGDLLAS